MQPVFNKEAMHHFSWFVCERMRVFWRRYNNEKPPWTQDLILQTYKFTNVYRVLDRTTQHLIREVIDNRDDVLFRILLFKIINNEETWDYLQTKTDISFNDFEPKKYALLLEEKPGKIFGGAYIIPPGKQGEKKHVAWLTMLDRAIKDGLLEDINKSASLEEIYTRLERLPMVGGFLAYQFAIDLNYHLGFDENSFVKAGVGAKRGIDKCTTKRGSYEDVICYVHEHFDELLAKYGETFPDLFGRKPALIDIQNCFCEIDKYLRQKMPSKMRIKRKFNARDQFNYVFPASWNIK